MNRRTLLGFWSIVLFSLQPGLASAQEKSADPKTDERTYRHQWALIIGIDYRKADYAKIGDRPKVGELVNPEKDAKEFSELLQKHYGYKKEHMLVLLGRQASHQEIIKNLGTFFICHPDKVGPEDSVLVYYAGHGDRVEDASQKDRGFVIPADVEYHLDQPVPHKLIHFHRQIVAQLKKSPARHKLLILDCCHSGEIFNAPLPAFNLFENRSNASAFKDIAVQAIASCRGTQEAGDGRVGNNSPFVTALKRALTTLPARAAEGEKYLPVTRVFLGMTPDFQYMPRNQSPSLRSLAGEDGEFHFFPTGSFDAYRGSDADVKLMQAMVPGEHGNWWFNEMPWMIPSLRQQIMSKHEGARTKSVTHHIHAKALRQCANAALIEYGKQVKTPLHEMRFKHLSLLIKAHGAREYLALLEEIAKDLADNERLLQAPDLHFLAVLQQSLNDKNAVDTYARALAAYKKARDDKQPNIMEALCRSDHGNYKLEVQGEAEASIEEFTEAYRLVQIEFAAGKESPMHISPFCIYLRSRRADASQRLKLWDDANNDLDIALKLARDLDPKHPLTSFVHRRQAWARMEQWRFGEAIKEFERSNEILAGKTDLVSRVAELHNRHGLAMAKRFQGQPVKAVQDYRKLVIEISNEFKIQARKQQEDFAVHDVKALLAERFVNTHERLVDCNLFGPLEVRDIAEAVDDARRGMRGCAALAPHRRSIARANLLYKQAIALCLPSPIQDADLAKEYCDAAQKIFEETGKPGELDYQHTLTSPLIDLLANSSKKLDPEKKRPKLAALRQAIQNLEAALAQNANRDHLEFLMFAYKILLEEGLEVDRRFLVLQDAERLQGLARRVLSSRTNETAAYLRPYHETVMRTRMQLNPKHVKELLEVQWEATMGSSFRAPVESQPTLALFMMDGKCFLFLDLPRSAGKVLQLDSDFTHHEFREATMATKTKIRLPREILRELESWIKAGGSADSAAQIRVHWRDPVHALGVAKQRPLSVSQQTPTYACPFELPANWRWTEPAESLPIVQGGAGKTSASANPR